MAPARSVVLAASQSKRWGELFHLTYCLASIVVAVGVVVPLRLYEIWGAWEYLSFGLLVAIPMVGIPICFPGKADVEKPWYERYWVKAQLWQAIFGFVGNYMWTHYFFQILGASYTMPSHRLNNVPLVMFLLTHTYFCFYHSVSNMTIRATLRLTAQYGSLISTATAAAVIIGLAYAIAFAETFSIAHYPHYTFKDRGRMYSVGSLFYALYFVVSFPLFFMMDETPRRRHTLARAALDALAAAMLVTLLLDFWRLAFGPLAAATPSSPPTLPFM